MSPSDRADRLEALDEPLSRDRATVALLKSEFALREALVLAPEGDEPYDFAVEVAGAFYRVAARAARRVDRDVVRFETGDARAVDYFAVYNPVRDESYLIPGDEATAGTMAVRFGDATDDGPSRDDYRFDDRLRTLRS